MIVDEKLRTLRKEDCEPNVTNSINQGIVMHEMGDDLYNWQSHIQESKAKEERKEDEIERH